MLVSTELIKGGINMALFGLFVKVREIAVSRSNRIEPNVYSFLGRGDFINQHLGGVRWATCGFTSWPSWSDISSWVNSVYWTAIQLV